MDRSFLIGSQPVVGEHSIRHGRGNGLLFYHQDLYAFGPEDFYSSLKFGQCKISHILPRKAVLEFIVGGRLFVEGKILWANH